MARTSVHMRTVWEWRRLVEAGYTVQQIHQRYGGRYSENLIRSYTKDERERMKRKDKEFAERVELQKLLRMAHEQQLEEQRRAQQLRWDRGEYLDSDED